MFKLRKMILKVNMYVVIVCEYPEAAKEFCDEYIKEVASLKAEIDEYIDEQAIEFERWCEKSVRNWFLDEDNIYLRLKRWILISISNHYLNKISGKLANAGLLLKSIDKIETRLNQYAYLNCRKKA